jgi:hypothetical protein
MKGTVVLLLIAGVIGGNDVTYFHVLRFRLYCRLQSRKEEITHLIRGTLFPVGLAVLLVGRPEGLWFWFIAGLLAFDSLNSLLDTILEPASRAPIGVPPAELAVHYVGTSLVGAAAATFVIGGWAERWGTTAVSPHSDDFLPAWTFVFGWMLVVLSVVLLAVESTLFVRHLRASHRGVDASKPVVDSDR